MPPGRQTLFALVALGLAHHGQQEIPPTATSHCAARDQEVLSQLEQGGRKMRAGVEECSGAVMLQHHHTSHCPFEWIPPRPLPGTHQLNLDAKNPPSSYSSPALSLSPSLSSVSLSPSLYTATLVSMGTALGLGVAPVTSQALGVEQTFFFFPLIRTLHPHSGIFKACRVCV